MNLLPTLCLATFLSLPAAAQTTTSNVKGAIAPVAGFTGEMSMTMESTVPDDMAVTDRIRFEPWQSLTDMFRDDIVMLMRGGPSDWAASDTPDAGPMDCANQRLLTSDGEDKMRQLGALMVANDLRPARIVMSQWCRSQQTYVAMERGMTLADDDALDGLSVASDAALNLLGAEQGVADIDEMRALIDGWDGGDGEGPLMLITHFPNIEALTNFYVYEGEMLILDPKRDNRVIAYLRLASARPDAVRFDNSVLLETVQVSQSGD